MHSQIQSVLETLETKFSASIDPEDVEKGSFNSIFCDVYKIHVPNSEAKSHTLVLREARSWRQYMLPWKQSAFFEYDLWVFDVPFHSHYDLEDVVDEVDEVASAMREKKDGFIGLYSTRNSVPESDGNGYLICLRRKPDQLSVVLFKGSEYTKLDMMEVTCNPTPRSRSSSPVPPTIAILILLLMGISISVCYFLAFRDPLWVEFPTPGSDGPRHQLVLAKENITEWLKDHKVSDYTLRLDEGSLMRNHLVDAQEHEFQAWFEKHYPQLAVPRDSGNYLNASYLGRFEMNMLDKKYHTAHCVAFIRRHITAIRSKRHVCPRDLSGEHVYDCLDSIEEDIFRGNPEEFPLIRHTDACD